MRDATHTRILGLILAALAAGACYRAPLVSGDDQVFDPNVEATAQKDGKFELMSWQDVDQYMIDSFVDDPQTEPGCAVGIVRDDQLLYLQGYGWARLPGWNDPGQRWGVGTVGAVGSVSKTFTAAAALQMHERGLIDVNAGVGSHLTTSNAALGNRMVASLLDHSSGIGGATAGAAFQPDWEAGSLVEDCAEQDPELEELWCQAVAASLARPWNAFASYEAGEAVEPLAAGDPGSGIPHEAVYSNVGYSVAGAVIDRAARLYSDSDGYEAWIWDEIGQYSGNLLEGGHMLSLALTHSWRDLDIPHRATGYQASGSGFQVFEAWDNTGDLEGWEGPAGGWAMTIGDLARFMIAMDNSEFFDSSAFLAAMRYEWSDLNGNYDDTLYGMGLFHGAGNASSPEYYHGGVIGGHSAVWAWWEDFEGHEIGVAMICNRSDAGVWSLKRSTDEIAAIAASGNPDPPQYIELAMIDPELLEGRTYAIDARSGYQVSAGRVFLPADVLDLSLQIEVESLGAPPVLQLTQPALDTRVGAGATPLATLRELSFDSPRFATAPRDVALVTGQGPLQVRGMTLEGSFADDGHHIRQLAIAGVIDTRQLATGGALGGRDVCAEIRGAGSACQPCADGAPACLAFRFENLQAAELGPDRDLDGVIDELDSCPDWPNPQADTDGNGIGDACECGDQTLDGRVDVNDILAISRAIVDPALASPLCDANDDGSCDVGDILAVNARIFGAPTYCERSPRPVARILLPQ